MLPHPPEAQPERQNAHAEPRRQRSSRVALLAVAAVLLMLLRSPSGGSSATRSHSLLNLLHVSLFGKAGGKDAVAVTAADRFPGLLLLNEDSAEQAFLQGGMGLDGLYSSREDEEEEGEEDEDDQNDGEDADEAMDYIRLLRPSGLTLAPTRAYLRQLPTPALRRYLRARGLPCRGCLERADLLSAAGVDDSARAESEGHPADVPEASGRAALVPYGTLLGGGAHSDSDSRQRPALPSTSAFFSQGGAEAADKGGAGGRRLPPALSDERMVRMLAVRDNTLEGAPPAAGVANVLAQVAADHQAECWVEGDGGAGGAGGNHSIVCESLARSE